MAKASFCGVLLCDLWTDLSRPIGRTASIGAVPITQSAMEAVWHVNEQLRHKGSAVVLSKAGASELGTFLSHPMKKSDGVAYFNCKAVDPKGPYFHMIVEDQTPAGQKIDFEVQIPHALAYTADLRRIGFISGP